MDLGWVFLPVFITQHRLSCTEQSQELSISLTVGPGFTVTEVANTGPLWVFTVYIMAVSLVLLWDS